MANPKEFVTSTGTVGTIEDRTYNRAYLTVSTTIKDPQTLIDNHISLLSHAEQTGARRSVLRAVVQPQVIEADMPYEVQIPLSLIDATRPESLVYIGTNYSLEHPQNDHLDVLEFWQNPPESIHTPLERVTGITDRFDLTTKLTLEDVNNLHKLWLRFGWTKEQVQGFIEALDQNENVWFSGIRDKTGKLVSATMAEAVKFDGIEMIEVTEFATDKSYEKQGLCTASLIGLVTQILKSRQDQPLPVILAELSTDARSDIVAHHAGFIVPNSQGRCNQILRENVAISNDYERTPNEGELKDFIVGILPLSKIIQYYSLEDMSRILDHITN